MGDKVSIAINTTLVGLFIVFIALIILAFLISLFGKAMGLKLKTKTAVEENNETSVSEITQDYTTQFPSDSTSDEELVAILTAAVLASMQNGAECNIKVKSFRRLPQQAPAWNTAGRMEHIAGKL